MILIRLTRPLTSIFLIVLMSCADVGQAAVGDPASLHLKIVEGDGATYAPGSRATRGVGVLVSDENGRPVDGATVGFALPMNGPGGDFASGGRTEIVITKADGLATAWGMRWNRVSGPFEIHVTAAKGQARASIAVTQHLSGAAQSASASKLPGGGGGSHKWLWITLAGAAAAGAAGFAGMKGGSGSGGSSSSSPPAASSVQIGAPSITLGRP